MQLNDLRIPAFVTREKCAIFTERLSYDILIKHEKVKNEWNIKLSISTDK